MQIQQIMGRSNSLQAAQKTQQPSRFAFYTYHSTELAMSPNTSMAACSALDSGVDHQSAAFLEVEAILKQYPRLSSPGLRKSLGKFQGHFPRLHLCSIEQSHRICLTSPISGMCRMRCSTCMCALASMCSYHQCQHPESTWFKVTS